MGISCWMMPVISYTSVSGFSFFPGKVGLTERKISGSVSILRQEVSRLSVRHLNLRQRWSWLWAAA